MNKIDMIDPRLRRDDVLKELVFRIKSAIGGKSRSERKVKAVRKSAKLATKAASEAKALARKVRYNPPPIPKKIKPSSGWD